ncbi:NUDIX domain-containing protein [Bacteroidota bacterium]
MNKEFAIAVKALIINSKGEILSVKRRPNDVHSSGKWDIPGGRLEHYEENPFDGLKREVMEETGLEVEILNPLQIDHFVRDDG